MDRPIVALSRTRPLILGSGSPRRLKLLSEAGASFEQRVSSIDETMRKNESPNAFAERMACEKAAAVASESPRDAVILGCDTIVVLRNVVLGKPCDKEHAFETLSRLSAQQHVVCTAVALAFDGREISGFEQTRVFFNQVTPRQIREYIESGEPMDKAGAYGIQGMGAFLVDRIEGNLDNVIGLPGKLLDKLANDVLREIQKS